ncbi:hypothetical protein BV898_14803 [Hypsibius exemplaris]|uniref:Kynurenine formamidase n=1 Tax=Hypsibius exemplaris TaxID=2072580 RepID=A0A9X6NCM9_HYPEX|nr:hypothetical protein BV898_14803 [Hypsibius exemplaris]
MAVFSPFGGAVMLLIGGLLGAPSLRLVASFPVARSEVSSDRLVDLTHTLDSSTIFWPNIPAPYGNFTLETLDDTLSDQGYYYRSKAFRAAEHGGTHVDAPSHFAKNGSDTGQLPAEQFFGPAIVIDVTQKVKLNPDYQVTREDINEHESRHGRIPSGAFVFMNSGWTSKWPDRVKVFGSADPANVSSLHYPSVHSNTTHFLIKERDIRGLGVDTPSVDAAPRDNAHPGTHIALADSNRIALENVANLNKMPAAGAFVLVLPMKIAGGSGGPVRILGVLSQ